MPEEAVQTNLNVAEIRAEQAVAAASDNQIRLRRLRNA